jgi:hypothetical protein
MSAEVTQADRDAVTAFHNKQAARIIAGDRTLGKNRDCIEQAFARHRQSAQADALAVIEQAVGALEAIIPFAEDITESGCEAITQGSATLAALQAYVAQAKKG